MRALGAAGFGADRAEYKNHTTHNQSRKWPSNSNKKPRWRRYKSLKGVDPKFLGSMRSARKHSKKSLKMQANNAKAMSAHPEANQALVQPKEVKPKIPKGDNHSSVDLPTLLTKPEKCARVHITKGLGLCQPKSKANADTKPRALTSAQAPAPKDAQAPIQAPQ
ncbi:PREDICTED: 60S ribosomal protein L29 [Myotis brandtii]|uniref:60S ribosomal protein L29 n=1 Tax=Myotis brandtii TaxID=109478 RepID=UPI0003BB6FF0|nr:PREDICTED: 60S ribosomal protein L29 [Myotis brandtii]